MQSNHLDNHPHRYHWPLPELRGICQVVLHPLMSYRHSHPHRNLPIVCCRLATSLHHLPLSRCIAIPTLRFLRYHCTTGLKNHLSLNQDNLVCPSTNILPRTNTNPRLSDRGGCHHIRHRLCQPAEVDCKGINLLAQMEWTQALRYSSQVHGYLQKYRGRNLRPASNFQGICRQELGHQPNHLGHHLNIPIVPTKMSHLCRCSHR